jgi:hypothetical protein
LLCNHYPPLGPKPLLEWRDGEAHREAPAPDHRAVQLAACCCQRDSVVLIADIALEGAEVDEVPAEGICIGPGVRTGDIDAQVGAVLDREVLKADIDFAVAQLEQLGPARDWVCEWPKAAYPDRLKRGPWLLGPGLEPDERFSPESAATSADWPGKASSTSWSMISF